MRKRNAESLINLEDNNHTGDVIVTRELIARKNGFELEKKAIELFLSLTSTCHYKIRRKIKKNKNKPEVENRIKG